MAWDASGGQFIRLLNYRPGERKTSAGFHFEEVSASRTVNVKAAQHRVVPVIDTRHPVLVSLRDADPLVGAVEHCDVVAAAIRTAFVQEDHAATSAPWRQVADASRRYSTQTGESEPVPHSRAAICARADDPRVGTAASADMPFVDSAVSASSGSCRAYPLSGNGAFRCECWNQHHSSPGGLSLIANPSGSVSLLG